MAEREPIRVTKPTEADMEAARESPFYLGYQATIERVKAALPSGWEFVSLEPNGDWLTGWELNVKGPPGPWTTLFSRGRSPDEAVDKFLGELRRQLPNELTNSISSLRR